MDAGARNVETRCSFTFDRSSEAIPIVYIQEPSRRKVPIPIPIPDSRRSIRRSGSIPPMPLKVELTDGHGEATPTGPRRMSALAQSGTLADAVTGQGTLDVLRYGQRPEGAAARRRARRGRRLRRPLLRQERHPHDQAGRVQAELRAGAQRAHLHTSTVAAMKASADKQSLLRQVSRHGRSTTSTRCSGTASRRSSPTSRARALDVGDAVRAGRRQPEQASSPSRRRRRGLDRVRAGRSGIPDLGRRLLGQRRRDRRRSRRRRRPRSPHFAFQTTLQNSLTISDVPGPTGGILIKTTTGAMISVNDTGITISNGKGARRSPWSARRSTVNAGALTVIMSGPGRPRRRRGHVHPRRPRAGGPLRSRACFVVGPARR